MRKYIRIYYNKFCQYWHAIISSINIFTLGELDYYIVISSMPKNALVIVVDALRADRVGSLASKSLTPNINKIIDGGTEFINAYSTTNTTDPAMTSLHTGRQVKSHGVHNHGRQVTNSEIAKVVTVPKIQEILQNKGYHTVQFGRPLGRWHVSGFDSAPTLEKEGVHHEDASESIVDHVKMSIGGLLNSINPEYNRRAINFYNRNRLINAGRDIFDGPNDIPESKGWHEDLIKGLSEIGDKKFYALLHLEDTHVPYTPPRELVESLLSQYNYSGETMSELTDRFPPDSYISTRLAQWVDSSWDYPETAVLKAKYDASVITADKKIGMIIEYLQENEIYEDTMLFVLADHGESLDENGIYFDHHGLYEPTIRIPLVTNIGRMPGDSREEYIQITDVVPTILDYLDINTTTKFDGQSLRPLLETTHKSWKSRKYILAEENHTQKRQMICDDSYKYIQITSEDPSCRYCGTIHSDTDELYRHASFYTEGMNLIDKKEEEASELRRVLERKYNGLSVPSEDDDLQEDIYADQQDALHERLESLGYM